MLYGFNKDDSHQLVKVARREGQRPRNKSSVKYPELLPQNFGISYIVKPNSTQAKGTTPVTCTVYSDGVATSVTISAVPLGADVTSGKWCTAWQEPSSGKCYVFPWEC